MDSYHYSQPRCSGDKEQTSYCHLTEFFKQSPFSLSIPLWNSICFILCKSISDLVSFLFYVLCDLWLEYGFVFDVCDWDDFDSTVY